MAKDKENTVGAEESVDKDSPKYTALCVFAAHVAARSGKGNVTAVVKSQSGVSQLLGSRNLANLGLLPDDKYRKARKLASDLDVPLIVGKAKCQAWLETNKIEGVKKAEILGDAPNSALASVKVGNSRKDLSF